jgi:hypothetical protein
MAQVTSPSAKKEIVAENPTAVIAVVSLAQGVSQSVSQRFAGLGTNVITITRTGSFSRPAERRLWWRQSCWRIRRRWTWLRWWKKERWSDDSREWSFFQPRISSQ